MQGGADGGKDSGVLRSRPALLRPGLGSGARGPTVPSVKGVLVSQGCVEAQPVNVCHVPSLVEWSPCLGLERITFPWEPAGGTVNSLKRTRL